MRLLVPAVALRPPLFVKEFESDAEFSGLGAAVWDEVAKQNWQDEMNKLMQAALELADASPSVRELVEWGQFTRALGATSVARARGESVDYSPFEQRFDAHVARYASLDFVVERSIRYLAALERDMPGASEPVWRRLAATASNLTLRNRALEQVDRIEALKRPLVLSFTAIDGRKIDLKDYRGKVVLLDFWATWCGPCIAELPNVKRVYDDYREQGFEIIGIALENARLAPTDSPEEAEAKNQKAKSILMRFTAANDMPWPQYYDGNFWKNEISTRSGIRAIPAMFLLDTDGVVVSTNARGEMLEQEVKRLLNL